MCVLCRGTTHFNQCDIYFLVPRIIAGIGRDESYLNDVTAHQINMEICRAFLKRYLLKGKEVDNVNSVCSSSCSSSASQGPEPNLDGTEGHSEHILFGTNVNLSEAQM